jgi:hypothetical protein
MFVLPFDRFTGNFEVITVPWFEMRTVTSTHERTVTTTILVIYTQHENTLHSTTTRMMISHLLPFFLLMLASRVAGTPESPPYTEEERQAMYIKRGHSWPPKIYPDTPGWKRILTQRFAQVRAVTDGQMKWDGFVQTLTASLMKNYTELGWGLARAPEELTQEIRQAIFDGLPTAYPEGEIEVIDGPIPLFIDHPDLRQKALDQLQPILESWSNIELVPSIAYGFRLYQNRSRLWMHVDRTQTHVISCIYHIASSDDSKPWPIVIEDYAGKTNSVVLHPGDLLLYESAKNFHGRPSYFDGSFYTSLFVHFQPKDPEWRRQDHNLDAQCAAPPDWFNEVASDEPRIIVEGTSMMMPDCPDAWCPLSDADHYEGPGKEGFVMAGGKMHPLDIMDDDEEEL